MFIYWIKKRNVILEIEKNRIPIHTENCGGRFDGFNLTIPFVRFAIYDDFMVISYFKKILLKFDEINKIEVKRHFVSKGIHIYHYKTDIPCNIIIWSKNCDETKKIIESKLNYVDY